MRVLLTSYGPFRKVTENITEQISKALSLEWNEKEVQLTCCPLPVEWHAARQIIEHTLTLNEFDAIVAMGHAEGYSAITIEKSYYNLAEGEDNTKAKMQDGMIISGAPLMYQTNVNTEKLRDFLKKQKIPTEIHDGKEGMTYLCNFVAYNTMHYIQGGNNKKTPFIFLHIPPNAMSFPTLVLGVRETIRFLVSGQ